MSVNPSLVDLSLPRQHFRGRAVVVVGAAPLAVPLVRDDTQVYLGVNGGVSSIPEGPACWLLNGRPGDGPGGHEPHHRAMRKQGAQRHFSLVIVHLVGGTEHADHVARVLQQQGTTWDALVTYHRDDWERIERLSKAWSRDMTTNATSTGLRAVSLVTICQPETLLLSGFSWESGYHYPAPAHQSRRRGHLRMDRRALRNLCREHPGLITHTLPIEKGLLEEDVRMKLYRGENPFFTQVGPRGKERHEPVDGPWTVRALKTTFYNGQLRIPGESSEVFDLRKPEHFKPKSMRVCTPDEATAHEASAQTRALQQEHTRRMTGRTASSARVGFAAEQPRPGRATEAPPPPPTGDAAVLPGT